MTPDVASAVQAAIRRSLEMDAPLARRLAAYMAASRSIAPAFVEPIEALVARLRASGAGAGAPGVGETMPPFALPDETGRIVTLAGLVAEGPAAVVLDRGHWCPYCRISTAALAQAERAIRNRGGRLVAIVPERQTYAQRLRSEARASFPILSDIDNGYALTLGLAFWIGADLQRLYASVGNRMPEFHGNAAWMLPIPATFVVGRDRRVTARFVEPDFRQRMAIDDLIAAVGAAARGPFRRARRALSSDERRRRPMPADQTASPAEIFARCAAMDVSLPEQLAAFWSETAGRSPAFAAEVEKLVARLKSHEVGESAPRPGEPMPAFALPDTSGRIVDLDSLLAEGPAVVIFHRGHWCPFCRMSSLALGRAQGRIEELGGRMVAILPDRQPYAGALRDFSGCRFPFLIDPENGYAMTLNLVFWVGEAMARLIAGIGNDVPRYQGNDSWLLPIPATFVVGRDGIVRERFLDPDYRTRFTVEALIEAVARA